MSKVSVDRSRCGATGNCVYWAPNTFELDDEGVAFVAKQDGDADDLIQQAIDNCPLLAIKKIEEP